MLQLLYQYRNHLYKDATIFPVDIVCILICIINAGVAFALVTFSITVDPKCNCRGVKGDWDFQISDLVKNPNGTDI